MYIRLVSLTFTYFIRNLNYKGPSRIHLHISSNTKVSIAYTSLAFLINGTHDSKFVFTLNQIIYNNSYEALFLTYY